MKRIAFALGIAAALAGCMSTQPGSTSGDLAAGRKQAEKLPPVTPESVTSQNSQTKAAELAEELIRESRRLESAQNPANPPK